MVVTDGKTVEFYDADGRPDPAGRAGDTLRHYVKFHGRWGKGEEYPAVLLRARASGAEDDGEFTDTVEGGRGIAQVVVRRLD